MQTRRTFLSTLTAIPLALTAVPAFAMEPPVYSEGGGIAIDGTDTVAYFTEGAPVPGSPDHTVEWNGHVWQFSSAENAALFEADPEAYAPQYGGYCAFAAAQGYVASTVPEAWSIRDGKLYLNFSLGVRDRWLSNVDQFISQANDNWPGILN